MIHPTSSVIEKSVWRLIILGSVVGITVVIAAIGAAFLTNIIERKAEAKHTFNWLVPVTEDTTDPSVWGKTFPSEYDGYKRTSEPSKTRYGGHQGSEALPEEKVVRYPWLTELFAGYAFSIDYRDRRGHAYMLQDQEQTKRVTSWKKPQPGGCLHCHSSIMPAFRTIGQGDVMKGFEGMCAMTYQAARDLTNEKGEKLIQFPVSCVDCHDPQSMALRVTRPGFIRGIQAFAESQAPAPHLTSIQEWRDSGRSEPYDPNAMATRVEMRSFVCAQCHVEYYFKGEGKILTYPWHKGLKVEEIESTYDDNAYSDWTHDSTGAGVLKAQHPEFEMWNQGVHARSGVSCADCHMPYKREGALKVSDHWIRSPLLNINRSCQTCHPFPEAELEARALTIQDRNHDLLQRAGQALRDMVSAVKVARDRGAGPDQLKDAYAFQRKGQWRLDFVAAENSMGFHAPQEASRILAEAIDAFRQGQIAAERLSNAELGIRNAESPSP